MDKYFSSLTDAQFNNIRLMINRMNARGINNPFAQAAIIAVASKESGFIPKSESSYAGTSNARIREVFKYNNVVKGLSEDQLTALKKDPEAFFNAIYSKSGVPSLGNTQPGDGWKYRGRALNQLTGRANYDAVGKRIGIDLISNPDLANDEQTALDILVTYFAERLKRNKVAYNEFKDTKTAIDAVNKANGGDVGGHAIAAARVGGFLELVNQYDGDGALKNFSV